MISNYQQQHTQATKLHAHSQFHLNRCIQDNKGCVCVQILSSENRSRANMTNQVYTITHTSFS